MIGFHLLASIAGNSIGFICPGSSTGGDAISYRIGASTSCLKLLSASISCETESYFFSSDGTYGGRICAASLFLFLRLNRINPTRTAMTSNNPPIEAPIAALTPVESPPFVAAMGGVGAGFDTLFVGIVAGGVVEVVREVVEEVVGGVVAVAVYSHQFRYYRGREEHTSTDEYNELSIFSN